jgi:hypothetical protein
MISMSFPLLRQFLVAAASVSFAHLAMAEKLPITGHCEASTMY